MQNFWHIFKTPMISHYTIPRISYHNLSIPLILSHEKIKFISTCHSEMSFYYISTNDEFVMEDIDIFSASEAMKNVLLLLLGISLASTLNSCPTLGNALRVSVGKRTDGVLHGCRFEAERHDNWVIM